MSLFRAREWWSNGNRLEEDVADLLASPITLAQLGPDGSGDCIIFGSPDGLLQVFRPQGSYQATDLILEYPTKESILEIGTGKLLPGSSSEQIAILHPRSIAVYSLTRREGHAEYGDQSMLTRQYCHAFPRSALCMIIGAFGGVKDKDFICVQSLDGMLMFYEQDMPTFNCFLPDVMIPGPLAYSSCADIFITSTSNWKIEAYSYYNLNQISDSGHDKGKYSKKIIPDWVYNTGENILSIQTLQYSNNSCCFFLTGEKQLYCLNDNGTLKFMKGFDFVPICSYAYLVGWYYENNARLMVIVVSADCNLYIYEEITLLWSCQLTFMPLFIKRAFFPAVPGSLVMVTDYGEVKCCYLGTEPELFTAPPLPSSDVDYEETHKELDKLQAVINSENDNTEIELISKAAEREMPFTININPSFDIDLSDVGDGKLRFIKHRVRVNLTPVDKNNVERIQVTFSTKLPLICSNANESISFVSDDMTVETDIYVNEPQPISDLNIYIVVLYVNRSGHIRVIKKSAALPLNMICQPVTPVKESKYKITIGINKPTIDLVELFNEFEAEKFYEVNCLSSVVAFNCADYTVTIISAKSSQRYRLQSDDLIFMNTILTRLIAHVRSYVAKKPYLHDGDEALKFTLHGNIPVDIVKSIVLNIEQHLVYRQKLTGEEVLSCLASMHESLNILSTQFIMIQKKLIMQYREKPPILSEDTDFLLEDTFKKITRSISNIQKHRNDIYETSCKISCGLELLYTMLELSEVKNDELELIKCALSCKNLNEDFQVWEENCIPNILYLLRSLFMKNDKDVEKFVMIDPTDSIGSFDVKKTIKYVRLLFDNVIKNPKRGDNEDTFVEDQINTDDGTMHDDTFKIPEGSLYGQKKPLLLARKEFQITV